MRAKEYLSQVEKINMMIKNKMIEAEQWHDIALSTTAHSNGDRVQSSGSQQKMADAVCKYIQIENDINDEIDRYVDTKNEIIKTIELLPSAEYDFLHKIYIQGKTIDEVVKAYDKTYSWGTTIHGRALKHVQDFLDEKRQNSTMESC